MVKDEPTPEKKDPFEGIPEILRKYTKAAGNKSEDKVITRYTLPAETEVRKNIPEGLDPAVANALKDLSEYLSLPIVEDKWKKSTQNSERRVWREALPDEERDEFKKNKLRVNTIDTALKAIQALEDRPEIMDYLEATGRKRGLIRGERVTFFDKVEDYWNIRVNTSVERKIKIVEAFTKFVRYVFDTAVAAQGN